MTILLDEFAFLLDCINMLWEKTMYTLADVQIHGKYNEQRNDFICLCIQI